MLEVQTRTGSEIWVCERCDAPGDVVLQEIRWSAIEQLQDLKDRGLL